MCAILQFSNLHAEPFKYSGYIQEGVAINTQDPKLFPGDPKDDKYDISMARTTLKLNLEGMIRNIEWALVGRADREIITNYLERLEENGAGGGDLSEVYNNEDIREAYVRVPIAIGHDTKLTLGRQIVALGETDFFQALDIFQGLEYRWRSFLEPEMDELYKPLILANLETSIPNLNGALQLIVHPPVGDREWIGSSIALEGGRWAANEAMTFDGTDKVFGSPVNYKHPKGDTDETTYGVRWSGDITKYGLSYQLLYLHHFLPDPVVNSAFNPYGQYPTAGLYAELFYPIVDVYGAAFNKYFERGDFVLSSEIAYISDAPYNIGANPESGYLVGGYNGVKEEDTVRAMIRYEKSIDLTQILKTYRPSLFSLQLFDTWIPGLDSNNNPDEQIVNLAGYSTKKNEHSLTFTGAAYLNYDLDRINPGLSVGWDPSYQGGFISPFVDINYTDNWRLHAQLDWFLDGGRNSSTDSGVFGSYSNLSVLYIRLRRQF